MFILTHLAELGIENNSREIFVQIPLDIGPVLTAQSPKTGLFTRSREMLLEITKRQVHLLLKAARVVIARHATSSATLGNDTFRYPVLGRALRHSSDTALAGSSKSKSPSTMQCQLARSQGSMCDRRLITPIISIDHERVLAKRRRSGRQA
jgi:hypothetical protein